MVFVGGGRYGIGGVCEGFKDDWVGVDEEMGEDKEEKKSSAVGRVDDCDS